MSNKIARYHNSLLLFSIAFFSFTIAAPPIFLDPDVAWHIAAGDYIIKQHGIPFYDPWSYAGLGQQWYNLSWLWDILCSLLNKLVGFHGLSVILAIFLSLICTYCYQSLVSRGYDLSHDAIMVSIALSSMLFIDLGCLRPQLLSCVMITFFINKLYNFFYFLDDKSLNFLPIVTLIWANSHGGFIILFALIIIFIGITIYEKKFFLLKKLIWIFIICFVCTLINPIGYKIYIGCLRTLNSTIINYINEWRPFIFGQSYSFNMLFLFVLISGCTFYNHYTELKIKNSDWIIGLTFLIASFFSIRNFSNFATSGVPFITGIVDRSLPISNFNIRLKNFAKIIVSIIFIALAIAINSFFIITKSDKKVGINRIPIDLITYVAANYQNYNIINDYNIGGYIILFGEGKVKHFIDGRAGTVFNEYILNQYIDVINRKISLLELADKHEVSGVIIHENSLNQEKEIERKKWRVVYSAQNYKLLVKNNLVQ